MRYVITAPPYNRKSAGIIVLYELQKWLVRFGKDAMMMNFKSPYKIDDEDIVVYPEIVSGNPLKAKRVVRYILNEPGKLGGDKAYDKNEILVAYDPYLARYSNGVFLTTPTVEEFFSNRGYERTIDCFWVGKGKNTNHPAIRNCVEITYQWPVKRRELAELLNRTGTFYSYDDRTMLLTEAALCGCQVLLIKGDELADPQLQPYDLNLFKNQLEQFIKLTWDLETAPEAAKKAIDEQLEIKRSRTQGSSEPSLPAKMTSIIILTLNQLEYTKRCVESIRRHTKEPYEILFVDNGSTDGTVKWLKKMAKEDGHCRLVLNKTNAGFARGCNQGIRAAKGDYLLLLNNDVVVTPKWLERMIACAEQRQQIGMIGPMSNHVSGPQLVKQVGYDTGSLSNLEAFADEHAMRHQGRAVRFWRVVGFCMLIKRAVFEKIGGLDERYGLGDFEDDDFSLRAAVGGYESWIAVDCFVHHFGSRTFAGAGIDYRESLNKNWAVFKRKWGIPEEVAYGAPYSLKDILQQGFSSLRHNYPLEIQDSDLTRGEELFAAGDTEGARENFKRVLEFNPNHIDALNNLGVIAFQEGDIDEAAGFFKKVLEKEPGHCEGVENLGNCLMAGKSYQEAMLWFTKALELRPDDPSLLNSLGNCLLQTEEFKKAEVVYDQSYRLNPQQARVGEILKGLRGLQETLDRERV